MTRLLTAVTESYVELLSESARFAGNLVGDLTEECSGPIRRTLWEQRDDRPLEYDDDDPARRGGRAEAEGDDCGCDVSVASVVAQCVDVVDQAFDRFHESFDGRPYEGDQPRARVRSERRPETRRPTREEEERRRREAEVRAELHQPVGSTAAANKVALAPKLPPAPTHPPV